MSRVSAARIAGPPHAEHALPTATIIAKERRSALRALAATAEDVDPRALEFARLRESGLRLSEIGVRYGLSRQRVAQIIDRAGRVPAGDVEGARRDSRLARSLERSPEILERYRAGLEPRQIARDTGLPGGVVAAVIAQRASDGDREQRKQTQRVAVRPPRYTDGQLTAGVRRVARRLGHPPSGREYTRLAAELRLASTPTVYARFGGWRRALRAAGLEGPAPARVYAPRWHVAACWQALLSVADELGDPPRYRRYLELAAQHEDLPSGSTVCLRLGLWSEIASALAETKSARARSERLAALAPGEDALATAERRRERRGA